MSGMTEHAAKIAATVIELSGGKVTFAEYDERIAPLRYFTPINWIAGWGLPPPQRKANMDKLAVFEACKMGLVRQTKTGYELVGAP